MRAANRKKFVADMVVELKMLRTLGHLRLETEVYPMLRGGPIALNREYWEPGMYMREDRITVQVYSNWWTEVTDGFGISDYDEWVKEYE